VLVNRDYSYLKPLDPEARLVKDQIGGTTLTPVDDTQDQAALVDRHDIMRITNVSWGPNQLPQLNDLNLEDIDSSIKALAFEGLDKDTIMMDFLEDVSIEPLALDDDLCMNVVGAH